VIEFELVVFFRAITHDELLRKTDDDVADTDLLVVAVLDKSDGYSPHGNKYILP
jgi:hypothetical protein